MSLFGFSRNKKPPKRSSCSGKAKMSELIAKEKAHKLRARGVKMYAYRCSYHKFASGKSIWHIGHRR